MQLWIARPQKTRSRRKKRSLSGLEVEQCGGIDVAALHWVARKSLSSYQIAFGQIILRSLLLVIRIWETKLSLDRYFLIPRERLTFLIGLLLVGIWRSWGRRRSSSAIWSAGKVRAGAERVAWGGGVRCRRTGSSCWRFKKGDNRAIDEGFL